MGKKNDGHSQRRAHIKVMGDASITINGVKIPAPDLRTMAEDDLDDVKAVFRDLKSMIDEDLNTPQESEPAEIFTKKYSLYLPGIWYDSKEAKFKGNIEVAIQEWKAFRAQRNRKITIARAPGYKTLELSGMIFGKKCKEQIFEPWLADMQEEYFEAIDQEKVWKSRFIRARSWITLLNIGISIIFTSTLKKIVTLWKVL